MLVTAACICTFALLGAGCSASTGDVEEPQGVQGAAVSSIAIGTLATEDILPYWVAEDEGLFAIAGLDAHVEVFQSATELAAALQSGEVSFAMTDPMVAASISVNGGTDLRVQWITLGISPDQGRFGIMSNDPSIRSLSDLAGKGVGVGSNTILEYVMDSLMKEADIPADQVNAVELQKLPVRFQAMMEGEVDAAALPASLLALGEASGAHVVADDTAGANLSQSVMVVRADFLDAEGGPEALDRMKQVWDQAVGKINADSASYRGLLVEKANLPEEIAASYVVPEYPTCQMPTNETVDPVLAWMREKGYLTQDVVYDAVSGAFAVR